jgi:hypothetical protein
VNINFARHRSKADGAIVSANRNANSGLSSWL